MADGQLRGVVALDGPSGTGKSTVARRLASALSARYLDTGAMYRSVTLAVLQTGANPYQPGVADVVAAIAADVVASGRLDMGIDPAVPTVRMDDADVAKEIRSAEVTDAVSAVAGVPDVRTALVSAQRRIIADVLDSGCGIVVEGRDIGNVVAPDAGLKVFLTATAEARARRRSRQDAKAGRAATVDATRAAVDRRDQLDTKTTPLRPAPDAVELDTTHLDVRAVLAELLGMVDERGMRAQAGQAVVCDR